MLQHHHRKPILWPAAKLFSSGANNNMAGIVRITGNKCCHDLTAVAEIIHKNPMLSHVPVCAIIRLDAYAESSHETTLRRRYRFRSKWTKIRRGRYAHWSCDWFYANDDGDWIRPSHVSGIIPRGFKKVLFYELTEVLKLLSLHYGQRCLQCETIHHDPKSYFLDYPWCEHAHEMYWAPLCLECSRRFAPYKTIDDEICFLEDIHFRMKRLISKRYHPARKTDFPSTAEWQWLWDDIIGKYQVSKRSPSTTWRG